MVGFVGLFIEPGPEKVIILVWFVDHTGVLSFLYEFTHPVNRRKHPEWG